MQADTQHVKAGNSAGKVRLLCLSDLDKRTTAYRRTEFLISRIENDLGGADQLSAAQAQIVRRAALTSAMAEDLAAQWLAGEPIDPMLFCTLSNAERRLYETVGLQRRPRDVTPDLKSYLAARSAETSS